MRGLINLSAIRDAVFLCYFQIHVTDVFYSVWHQDVWQIEWITSIFFHCVSSNTVGFCPCVCKCQQLNEHKFLHCVLVGLSRQQFFFGIEQLLSVQEKKNPWFGVWNVWFCAVWWHWGECISIAGTGFYCLRETVKIGTHTAPHPLSAHTHTHAHKTNKKKLVLFFSVRTFYLHFHSWSQESTITLGDH